MNKQEERMKHLDKTAWWFLGVVTAIAAFLVADMVGFIEFFWH